MKRDRAAVRATLLQAVIATSSEWRRHMDDELKRHGCSAIELAVVREVLASPGTNQRALAAELNLGSALVRILDDLATRGVLERREDSGDRRNNRLYPLPSARRFLQRGEQALRSLEADLLSGLDPQDLERHLLLLAEVLRRLGAGEVRPS
ncbi:MarR family winged helix-turn-helix transcriptional regulator [Phenylobacterium sp.]|uniref:MarR family winged helix-turn-helix transcriptional regulator n=1 Tax=Phenylobacterium sp. TaxID=1871053 RepID=UPI002C86D603|nr:MarR family winged helix-turn-helix transcriptional regulator [Phenylobacterium sp.]HVI34478.1 MarR family winged helix-turn-helix transcriptional regulator [Phenylobacterium sp.]